MHQHELFARTSIGAASMLAVAHAALSGQWDQLQEVDQRATLTAIIDDLQQLARPLAALSQTLSIEALQQAVMVAHLSFADRWACTAQLCYGALVLVQRLAALEHGQSMTQLVGLIGSDGERAKAIEGELTRAAGGTLYSAAYQVASAAYLLLSLELRRPAAARQHVQDIGQLLQGAASTLMMGAQLSVPSLRVAHAESAASFEGESAAEGELVTQGEPAAEGATSAGRELEGGEANAVT